MAAYYNPTGQSTFNTDDEQFFKEYCISDLSQYLLNKVALRWRTKKEVISGKGEHICGDKSCSSKEKLTSWEVNFGFIENGKKTNQLVKLKLCKDCSIKLNSTSMKSKKSKSKHKSKHKKSHKKDHEAKYKSSSETTSGEGSTKEITQTAPPVENQTLDDSQLWKNDSSETAPPAAGQTIEDYLSDLF